MFHVNHRRPMSPPQPDWNLRYPDRCYFYPGRDCPGWQVGGLCLRVERLIPQEIPEGGPGDVSAAA
jgi:hypothetical protein